MVEAEPTDPANNTPGTFTDAQFMTPNIQLWSEEAEHRENLIENVSYSMLLRLTNTLEGGYMGAYQVTFDLKEMPADSSQVDIPFFIDFQGKLIRNVKVNGVENIEIIFDRQRIQIP